MRKILVISMIIASISCKSQVTLSTPVQSLSSVTSESFTIVNSGTYFKDLDNRYNQWVGTWEYVNGNTIFRIVIQKQEGVYYPKNTKNLPIPINCYMDLLVGGYYYKDSNGTVVNDHLVYSDIKFPPLLCSSVINYPDNSNNKLIIYYREIEKSPGLTQGFVDFTLLPGSTTQAKWVFNSVKKRNYSVPDNIILTKVP
jgi:hypothetical protein